MDWGALLGGLLGAGIPSILAYLGLRRDRQSADAGAFGPAVLLLIRIAPVRVTLNANAATHDATWAALEEQLDKAREGLLIVSAGHPSSRVRQLAADAEAKVFTAFVQSKYAVNDLLRGRDNPEQMGVAQRSHAAATAAVQNLIRANFERIPRRLSRRDRQLPTAQEQEQLPGPDGAAIA